MGPITRRLLFAAVALLVLGTGSASAGTCSAAGLWNPLPSASNITKCGPAGSGVDQNNPNAADVSASINAALSTSFTFAEWDKDQVLNKTNGGGNDGSFYFSGTTKSGTWFWDADESIAAGNSVFALVLKDGNAANGNIKWAWFLLDNVNKVDNCIRPAGFTHCGTWSMYGKNRTVKDISHMTIYGAPGPAAVPEPAVFVVLAVGVVVVAAAGWKLRAQ